jgi:hypothetical protein
MPISSSRYPGLTGVITVEAKTQQVLGCE